MRVCELQDLFYRCKFAELLATLDRLQEERGSLDNELVLLKANALYELHRVGESKEALKSVSQTKDGFDENYLYAVARVSYLDGDFDSAGSIFEEIYARTDDERHKFKALLGIANKHYSQGEFAKIVPLLPKLTAFEPLERDDERICLMLFLGNYYRGSGSSYDLAKQYYKKALASAARNTWTYWIIRSLFYIALVCEKENQSSELMWTLEMLQSFIDETEHLYFSRMVNEYFKAHFSINTPMEFDTSNRRILLKSKWVPFHEKPLLFQFLLLLHQDGSFVNKESIAVSLWPQEDYKPRIHDPRIFDIAKRARQIIETDENRPVVLLSGRMGYKLAST